MYQEEVALKLMMQDIDANLMNNLEIYVIQLLSKLDFLCIQCLKRLKIR